MWKKIKDDLESGLGKVKWFSSLLSERMKIEISLMKLLYQSAEMEKKRNEFMKAIGERFYELKNSPEKQTARDAVILEALRKIEALDAEIENIKRKASDISRIEV